jgi:RNA polymerase sigma-70 factor (ECF subfamily)
MPLTMTADSTVTFEALVAEVEPTLRRALVAAYGAEIGREAAADALAWAWEHLDRVRAMDNPGGYLWRVGQTAARRHVRWRDRRALAEVPDIASADDARALEPALAASLRALSPQQRAAVLLVHGWDYTLVEAAAALGCGVSSLRNHLARGLDRVRRDLGVTDDA